MNVDYAELPHHDLPDGTGYISPNARRPRLTLDHPATEVMTDFADVQPRTVASDVGIDEALDRMRGAGVRLLLVCNDTGEILGIVTSYDIQGERPVQLVHSLRVPRSAITVANVMTPRAEIRVLDLAALSHAKLGHVVATLRALEQRHVLVCDGDSGGRVCGLLSAADIGRRLGTSLDELVWPARSFAEIVHDLTE